VRAGLTLGITSMLGAYGGARVAQAVPATWLMAAFTAVMAVTAIAMLRPRGERAAPAAPSMPRLLAIGLAVGVVTGFVGAGGGFVVVPALVLLGGLPM